MFEQAILHQTGRANRAWSAVLGLSCQFLMAGAAVVAPMIFPQMLPPTRTLVSLFVARVSAPPPLREAPAATRLGAVQRVFQYRLGRLLEPLAVPAKPQMIVETAPAAGEGNGVPGGVPGGIPAGAPGGIPGGLDVAIAIAVPPPAPAPVAAPAPARREPIRLKVGGLVQRGKLIHEVTPAYPVLARAARISGVVQLLAVIAPDGTVRQLQVESGHPLLVRAALDAVKQWRYRPTLLNGEPVEVISPITVTFRLN